MQSRLWESASAKRRPQHAELLGYRLGCPACLAELRRATSRDVVERAARAAEDAHRRRAPLRRQLDRRLEVARERPRELDRRVEPHERHLACARGSCASRVDGRRVDRLAVEQAQLEPVVAVLGDGVERPLECPGGRGEVRERDARQSVAIPERRSASNAAYAPRSTGNGTTSPCASRARSRSRARATRARHGPGRAERRPCGPPRRSPRARRRGRRGPAGSSTLSADDPGASNIPGAVRRCSDTDGSNRSKAIVSPTISMRPRSPTSSMRCTPGSVVETASVPTAPFAVLEQRGRRVLRLHRL